MHRRHRPDILIALALFAASFTVYQATLTPGLSYQSPDGNELVTVCYTLGLAHSTGYPLYTWLGKLFTFLPVGDVAYRINLMSATLGALGVASLYALLRLLSPTGVQRAASRLSAAFAALLFAFSVTFWSQTGIAEVYTPNLFMLTLTLIPLLLWSRVEERGRTGPSDRSGWRRFLPPARSLLLLFLFGLTFGLSLGTHMSNLGFAPAFALFLLLVNWRRAIHLASIASAGGGFLLGLLQFLWLPLKASTLTDAVMRARAPGTLRGFFDYTLGAFPQLKFAFPLAALPGRLVIYLDFLRQQFGLLGILLGIGGMAALLWRRPKRFYLLVTAYLVQVWFFIQYSVFDLDVFFIPAHLLYALFIGFGLTCLLEFLLRQVEGHRVGRTALVALLTPVLVAPVACQLHSNWETNDRSDDVAISDFYANVFQQLPAGAVLVGQGGVFGYDMFYYRLVEDVRPDVVMPQLSGATASARDLADREVYSTVQPGGRRRARGPGALPSSLVSAEPWAVPLLLGSPGQGGRRLTLYHLVDEPPRMMVPSADPQVLVGETVAGWMLEGYDLESRQVEAGGTLHLTLYWRPGERQKVAVSTIVGDIPLEVHEPGMGNLQRYVQTFDPPRGGVLVEDFRVVVPSTTEAGTLPLALGVSSPFRAPDGEEGLLGTFDLGTVTILTTE